MKRKLLFLCMLLMLSSGVNAHIYLFKPYLVIKDTVHKKTFRIKHYSVVLKTNRDSIATPDFIVAYKKNLIITRKHGNVRPIDIEEISFKPRKAKRMIQTAIGTAGLAYEAFALNGMGRATLPNEATGYLIGAIIIIPVTVLSVAIVGGFIQLITHHITLHKKDCIIYTVTKDSGITDKFPLKYNDAFAQ